MFMLLQIQNPVLGPGTGTFTSHTIEILLICLVMFLLGWFLHHLIYCSQHKTRIAELDVNLKSARTRISDLEGDLDSCNAAMINVKGENAALSTKLARLEDQTSIDSTIKRQPQNVSPKTPDVSEEAIVSSLATDIVGSAGGGFDADGAKGVYGRKIKEDDLKIIEGIGPKTEELLHHSSVHTWRQLGNTSVPQLQNILDKAGDRFQLLNPGTWPKQARMAAEGEWVKLREYQDYLVGGVEPEGDVPSGDDAGAVRYIMGKKIKQDDLTIVEGIGPKIQSLMQDNGIDTWLKLSQSSVSKLQEILNAAGDRYRMHDPGTWPKQAALAQQGKWDQLRLYQDTLEGGKEPG
jgi:predicted flap endonuclease-1-like 5' DNA nuclease